MPEKKLNKCIECDENEEILIPIVKKDKITGKYICKDCIADSEDYRLCCVCGRDQAYPREEINYDDKCRKHIGQSAIIMDDDDMDEEEVERLVYRQITRLQDEE